MPKKVIKLKRNSLITETEKSKYIIFENWNPRARVKFKCVRHD